MIGAPKIMVLAFKSSSGFWEPYMLYPNGPYPGRFGPPKDFEFIAISDGNRLGHKPAGERNFDLENVDAR